MSKEKILPVHVTAVENPSSREKAQAEVAVPDPEDGEDVLKKNELHTLAVELDALSCSDLPVEDFLTN